jgi:hypothetical protein
MKTTRGHARKLFGLLSVAVTAIAAAAWSPSPAHAAPGARAAALTMMPASAAGASHSRIVPREYFSATVNGSTGSSGPVTIEMACAGPVHRGETGHPLAGQSVGVKLVPVPSSSSTELGYTGTNGSAIGAFFGAPPPSATADPSYVAFAVYRMKPIPTTLELPCGGTGHVIFVPLPALPPARSISIPVAFVGQP